jgi:hypothetical protein
MARIAKDETAHAQLSWEVDRWASRRMSKSANRRVREARQQTFVELKRKLAQAPQDSVAQVLGLPTAEQAQQMAGGLETALHA